MFATMFHLSELQCCFYTRLLKHYKHPFKNPIATVTTVAMALDTATKANNSLFFYLAAFFFSSNRFSAAFFSESFSVTQKASQVLRQTATRLVLAWTLHSVSS